MAAAFLPSVISEIYETTIFIFMSDFMHFPPLFNKDVRLEASAGLLAWQKSACCDF